MLDSPALVHIAAGSCSGQLKASGNGTISKVPDNGLANGNHVVLWSQAGASSSNLRIMRRVMSGLPSTGHCLLCSVSKVISPDMDAEGSKLGNFFEMVFSCHIHLPSLFVVVLELSPTACQEERSAIQMRNQNTLRATLVGLSYPF